MLRFLLVIAALLFAVGRFTLVSHTPLSASGTYAAFAHLFVGGLIGAGFASGQQRASFWGVAGALTVVEVVAFFVTR